MRVRALIVAALLPVAALAQEAAAPLPQDPRAPRFDEVARGFFTGFEVGYLTLFDTPTGNRTRYPYAGAGGGRSDGFVVGVDAGYEVTDRLALALYALGASSSAGTSYGSFSLVSFGGDVRVTVAGSRDANGVERLHFYLHGRGGYLASSPDGLFASGNLYLAGGPGVEYDTRLRHFSVGLAADVAYLPSPGTAGIAVTPTVRYTF